MATTGLSKARVAGYIERFPSARVCVLGDVMLDRYFWGEVERISPEAPVPVVHVDRRSSRLGGAANVAANLRDLDVQVTLLGTVGGDRAGEEIVQLLEARGIDAGSLVVESDRETTEKVRIIARSQQVVRADFEESHPLGSADLERLEVALRRCADYDALIVSDYGKGVIARDYLGDAIANFRQAGVPVLIDPHVGHFDWYRGASVVTPNAKEAASYYGAPHQPELFNGLAFRMRRDLEIDALLVTRGEHGMSLFTSDDKQVDIPTVAKEVYDVTGAGDTVISVLAACVASGVDLLDAVIVSNQAAGEVVKEIGTTTVTRDTILRSLD